MARICNVLSDLRENYAGCLYNNLSVPRLKELSLQRKEGILTASGALRVSTGKYTGRSPGDKFIVCDPETKDRVDWKNNQAMSPEVFWRLYNKMIHYLQNKDLFVFDGYAGADRSSSLAIRVINEFAWQNLFIHQLLLRTYDTGRETGEPEFTILAAPGCTADPVADATKSEAFIILNLTERLVLIGGTHYAGEMKKSVFSAMNYFLPRQSILSMHCSANQGVGGDIALFFGLSGTGKTSLSADPDRQLIGDDEHGWSDRGIFNIEGGCYAKCIHLSRENEPQIWDAIQFGSVLENVVIDEDSRQPDYASEAITENTRAAYPIRHIPHSIYPGIGGHPSTILFLTADAFGVLPPIAKLSPEQAMFYFLSGYTSKLAGTERGIAEPQATFSACFGSPFLPLPPAAYADLLKEKITRHQTQVFLINTGWQGGRYGTGKRINIQYTRRMVAAAINGQFNQTAFTDHPVFNLSMPLHCSGIPDSVLNPQDSWADPQEYRQTAWKLAEMFHKNLEKFVLPPEVVQSGPHLPL
ncbi:phosphoenolpyruvate carboxykinase (ATP) [Acetonema longum]|uniref:Phosphoenolpyruvate carboxykinase (ATP) n=1 Tax=Acetonema longum DSM 6540 TaxID=1009370 RepID=F7NIL9_9FIRM|nr:phosphoenolpyruvate carboxykinase (ATP) [Acetonema longum]EGO64083.1 phosphoenolpyruvate carboxykinase [Acetonema longum DSM 6540]